jgi:hypothetical protein
MPNVPYKAKTRQQARAAHGYPMPPLVTMDRLWTLATTWCSRRLQKDSRRPQPDEVRSIFAAVGLGGDFWGPQPARFAIATCSMSVIPFAPF